MQLGKQTIAYTHEPTIISSASIVGPKEGEGNHKDYYDIIIDDALYGEDNWEKAESKLVKASINASLDKIEQSIKDQVRFIFAGDLQNQLVASTFALREMNKPFLGMYGACSTMGESILMAAMAVDGGYADYTVAAASSHYCTAEKQFRYPLEYGAQKKDFSSMTVTGSGAVVIGKEGEGPRITKGITGKIIDMGIKDAANMGAAMAPAAADTIMTYFNDTNDDISSFDQIITGDLGIYGSKILCELLLQKEMDIRGRYFDCGSVIYNDEQMTNSAGGSGCGCSAVTLCGYILEQLSSGNWNKVLFLPTGALLSPLTVNEGETIPCIAQGVVIES